MAPPVRRVACALRRGPSSLHASLKGSLPMYEPFIRPPHGYVPFDETSVGWPEIEPRLLEDGRGLVPTLPIDVFPPEWARWIEDSAQSAGTPDDYVAQGVLAAVTAVCGAGVMAQVSTAWAEPLVQIGRAHV